MSIHIKETDYAPAKLVYLVNCSNAMLQKRLLLIYNRHKDWPQQKAETIFSMQVAESLWFWVKKREASIFKNKDMIILGFKVSCKLWITYAMQLSTSLGRRRKLTTQNHQKQPSDLAGREKEIKLGQRAGEETLSSLRTHHEC